MKDEEGGIEVDGHQVWYRRVGEGGVPLLLLHGGPGAGHDLRARGEAQRALVGNEGRDGRKEAGHCGRNVGRAVNPNIGGRSQGPAL